MGAQAQILYIKLVDIPVNILLNILIL